jgi:RNA polymerase sigma factor (sigma-70 family)
MNRQEEQDLLLRFRPWLRITAIGMCRQFPERAEDLAQEGWIAMWRSIGNFPGDMPSDSWLKASAVKRMYSHIRDWMAQCRDIRITDLTGVPGIRAVGDRERTIDVWDALRVDLGDVEMAYHHGEIMNALAALPTKQRLYVWLKYWKGYTDTEMKTIFGYRPKTLGAVAHKTLAEDLVHLSVNA